jgi:ferredoxin-NADP reductase
MDSHSIKIKSIKLITHDVLQIVTENPHEYNFTPGQAAEISINKEGWLNEKRPFTFTSLPHNDYLEFVIKTYPARKGVTNELLHLRKNDELMVHDIFGAIEYKGEGLFIAGGAGITPFICIFRYLHSKNEIAGNKLIFANKTKDDIILYHEFKDLLGDNFINILSDKKELGYLHGQITEDFLKINMPDNDKNIYVCGPPPMMDAINKQLANLHINEQLIVKEGI